MSQASSATIPGGLPLASPINPKFSITSPAGTAGTADNCDLKYSKILAMAATPQVLDLTSLTDVFGTAISFARIRSILVSVQSTTNTHNLKLGYATTTTNAWTSIISNPGQVIVQPSTALNNSGCFIWIAPNTTGAVVGGSNKLLNLDPSANSFAVWVEITGCSV